MIDAVINDRDQENPPTLETVKDAMISGLLGIWWALVYWMKMKMMSLAGRN
ncbi:MAG: hypothetical protein IPH22_10045 [Nitrosomonas sp.]|nr:hypothetical protein [Nitrosomonas sp.]